MKVGSSGGRKVASLQADTRLPLVSSSRVGNVTVALEGVETTSASATRALDGSVQEASSLTKGSFQQPPPAPAVTTQPREGTMTVEIHSRRPAACPAAAGCDAPQGVEVEVMFQATRFPGGRLAPWVTRPAS